MPRVNPCSGTSAMLLPQALHTIRPQHLQFTPPPAVAFPQLAQAFDATCVSGCHTLPQLYGHLHRSGGFWYVRWHTPHRGGQYGISR